MAIRAATSNYVILRKKALRLCRQVGLPPQDVEDAAGVIVQRIRRLPAERQRASAIYATRMLLARHLGVPWRRLSGKLRHMGAIGDHESIVRVYNLRPANEWRHTFDYHNRRFAIENQVCPRCSVFGAFTEEGGKCVCGFAYGHVAAAAETVSA